MQLDRTSIAIRERGFLEILDLALRVTTRYLRPLFWSWVVAAIPLMLINYWMTRWMTQDLQDTGALVRYLNTMILLVVVQAPLVSVFTTCFLGQAVFMNKPTTNEVLSDVSRSVTPLVWCVLIVRAIALSWLLLYFARQSREDTGLEMLLLLLALYVIALRGTRPYLLEIILLERNPLRKREGEITVAQRSRGLHAANTSDLLGRWLAAACISIALAASLICSAWFFSGMLFVVWDWGSVMIHGVIPLTLWAVAGFMAVVRFLSYMDLRIRNEGWEIELLLRAAAERLAESTL